MGHKLKFGTSSGTGYTRAKFPTHLGVAKGPLNKMSDFRLGSQERVEEYDRRGWKQDHTTTGHKNYKKKTAISSAKTKDEDQIKQDQINLTNSFSTSNQFKNPDGTWKTADQNVKSTEKRLEANKYKNPDGTWMTAEENIAQTQKNLDAKKDAKMKPSKTATSKGGGKEEPSFLSKLGAGLEEAGATISMAYGKGGTGTMTTANMAYKKMKEDLKTKRLLNERRAYMNTDAGNMEIEGEDPVEKQDEQMKKDVYSGDNIKKQEQESDAANQAIVSENASIENRRDNNAGATDCPGGTCPAYE